ncbi:MAG: transporter substrate-binding domain-containing protein [Sebaldella sp.]|nr:transporter substrate-binding domain-containing protein [Sebaldella sp.]
MKSKVLKLVTLLSVFMLIMSCGSDKKEESKTGDSKEVKKYVIGSDTAFAPFEFKKDGKYEGIDIDIVNEIAKVEGFEVEWRHMDFSAIIGAVQSGQLDGAIAGMTINDERRKAVDFSEAYYDSGIVGIVKADNDTIKSPEDFKDKRFAVKKGTTGAEYAQSVKEKYNVKITIFEDTSTMIQSVINGQADVAFDDYPVIAYAITQQNPTQLRIATERLNTAQFGFAVKKGANQELLQKFNDGLKKLKDSGKYDEILEKYTGKAVK